LLALEWANYVITTAFILVRMFKLLLVAITSIGRIDRPFLAVGVGQLGPLELDPYPTIHTRDLVAHDAHRHPYIETLGLMYLMKLRYADDFGNRAGSAWRLIFVYTLMPWFHKYRIHADDRMKDDGKDEIEDTEDDPMTGRGSDPCESSMKLAVLAESNPRSMFASTHGGVEIAEDITKIDMAQAMREMEAEISRLKDQPRNSKRISAVSLQMSSRMIGD
jgi:hypothetical protein